MQGFEDCASVNMVFKLFESFDPLIYREIIKNLISKTYISLFQMFAQDLDQVYKIFQYGREHPPISDNMPAVSGIQMWCKSLLERINEPMKKVQQVRRALSCIANSQRKRTGSTDLDLPVYTCAAVIVERCGVP